MSISIEPEQLFQPVPRLAMGPTESVFAGFLRQITEFIKEYPGILEKIEDDQDAHAKEKKAMRLKDKRWEQNQQPGLDGLDESDESEVPAPKTLELEEGRPRTSPFVVFIGLMMRGYGDGISSRGYQDWMVESQTLRTVLANRGEESMPARSTLSENVNCVSSETREYILEKLLEWIKEKGLDEFEQITSDTTAVEADTRFPMDASVLLRLIRRIWRRGHSFETINERLEDYQRHWMEFWLDKMKGIVFKLHNVKKTQSYRKQYRKMYEVAEKACAHLEGEVDAFEERLEPDQFKPSERARIKKAHEANKDDLQAARRVIGYSRRRVLEGKSTPASEKVLSLSDEDAAFIKKGDREPTIGYRPLLTRSKEGFVTDLQVPEGNPSDSTKLEDVVEGHQRRTGVVPRFITVDDGFANESMRETLLEKDEVKQVCITGGRGKRMTPQEQWESEGYQERRRKRSAVESLVYSVKFSFGFGQLARRGAGAVRAELLEDVLAYNFCRMMKVQKQPDKIPKPA